MIEFIDRLKRIQSERLYHPWMTRLGVGKGSAQSMAGVKDEAGHIKHGLPSMSTLLQICRIENASYRYLVEGIGEPFQVTRLSSDRALAEHLEAVWSEGGWSAVLIEQDDALRAVVLANACQIEVGAWSITPALMSSLAPSVRVRLHGAMRRVQLRVMTVACCVKCSIPTRGMRC